MLFGHVCSSGATGWPALPHLQQHCTLELVHRYQGAAAAEFARKQGYRNVGVVYEDVSYGFGEPPVTSS
jgi:hypothetical protein